MKLKLFRRNSKIRNIIGSLLIVIGVILIVQKKEYYFQECGFECTNVSNSVVSSFSLTEKTTVHFNFFKEGQGDMTVTIKDSSGNIVFFSDREEFSEKYSRELPAGTYSYNIDYSGVCGNFELYAARRSVFGFEY